MTAKIEGVILLNAYAGQAVYIVNINVFHNNKVSGLPGVRNSKQQKLKPDS